MNISSVSSVLPSQVSSETSAVSREARFVEPPVQVKVLSAQATRSANGEQSTNQEELKTAVKSVREYIQPFNNNLEFSVNDDTNKVVVKVVDSVTKEVLLQIPSKEMIAMAKALDSIKGLFVKQQA